MIICTSCDNKLDSFHRFRIESRGAQLQFAEIIKSHFPLHYGNNHIEFFPPLEPPMALEPSGIDESMYVNVENLYSSTPAPSTIQSNHEYETQCTYISHDLHSLMDDDNQNDHNSLVLSTPQELYVNQPHCSPLSPATPIYVPVPQITPQNENCYQPTTESTSIIHVQQHQQFVEQHQVIEIENQPIENNLTETFPEQENDSFTFSDLDDEESQLEPPSDRNNVDNAIDKKIEEFTQNKGTKAPKICTICNKIFRTNYKLSVHMETHKKKSFVCDIETCKKVLKTKNGLKEHSAKHAGIFNFTCEDCPQKFFLKTFYVAHRHHLHSDKPQKTFECSLCPKVFKSKQNLIDHENCHLGVRCFKCEICLKTFNTKTHLDVHIKSHGSQANVACPVCNKILKSKIYLKTHLKTHDDSLKNYKCDTCKKKFIQKSDLQKHMKTHTKEKTFICET